MKFLVFLSIIIVLTTTAYAQKLNIIDECQVTPSIWELKSPPEIATSNNLTRFTGSPNFAKGDFIVIEGNVVDSKCVPISDAIIEIWQANSLGGENYDFKTELSRKDFDFVSTGSTITNNLGEYSFLTVLPGALEKEAPKIHFRIRHKDFLPVETIMFFENQPLNSSDKVFNNDVPKAFRDLLLAKLQKTNMNNDQENIKYIFDITLEGNNKYKKY